MGNRRTGTARLLAFARASALVLLVALPIAVPVALPAAGSELDLDSAKSKGLVSYGPMNFSAGGKPISCFGRDYTFAWLAIKKTA